MSKCVRLKVTCYTMSNLINNQIRLTLVSMFHLLILAGLHVVEHVTCMCY